MVRDVPSEGVEASAPSVEVPGGVPVRRISREQLRQLGHVLSQRFQRFKADRLPAEYRWLRAQRQYSGVYDPEVASLIPQGRSQAYPRVTRTRIVSVVARLMNLMFPGDERNWVLEASPSPDLSPEDVDAAVRAYVEASGGDPNAEPSPQTIEAAVRTRAVSDAEALSKLIDDQLEELGGDQTQDFITLNRRVVRSGAIYGIGLLRGPFARRTTRRKWVYNSPAAGPQGVDAAAAPSMASQFGVEDTSGMDAAPGAQARYRVEVETVYKPVFEFLPVWDFFPDMAAKTLREGAGYYIRTVMSKSQLLDLATREDFFGDAIRSAVSRRVGAYTPMAYETMLRTMGVAVNADLRKLGAERFEVLTWHGPVDGETLAECGVDVPEKRLQTEINAEVWMVGDTIIKVDMSPWERVGVDVPGVHIFMFDEDDISPLGQGLCDVLRDTQMSICNATRMMLDNAAACCGPMIEVNEELLSPAQDVRTIEPFKVFVRDNNGLPENAALPAVRDVRVDSHVSELMGMIRMFGEWADADTFASPQTGGDMALPSEPMRTLGGASMLRGEAALPFKDVVRQFDVLTASVIWSLVVFNRTFNPGIVPAGDFNVVARGSTSLIAKELRATTIDALSQSMTPEERLYVDVQKLMRARLAARDLNDMLLPDDVVARSKAEQAQQQQQATEMQQRMAEAQMRKVLADAFKNIQQGVKNAAAADAGNVKSALSILEQALLPDAGVEAGQPPAEPAMPARPTPALDRVVGMEG